MKRLKFSFVLFLLLLCFQISAQNSKIKKAGNLYKVGKYAEAIKYYEAGLAESDNLNARTKLADSYYRLNKIDKAEALYQSIIQEKRVKIRTYFRYGEVLMSKGKYDEAKERFGQYNALKPDDEKGILMLEACDQVKLIQPYFEDVFIEEFAHNSSEDDNAPVFFGKELIFSSDRNMGVKLLKQKSGTTGRDFIRLYQTTVNEMGTFESPASLSGKFNVLNKNTAGFTFDAKRTTAVFSRNSNDLSRKDEFNMQLYSAEATEDGRWKDIKVLEFCSKEYNYMHPALSPDGRYLYFVSDKAGSEGGTDIFVSRKTSKGWSRPRNLGPQVNTAGNEGFPFVSKNGQLYFCSKGHPGYGGFDIFFTKENSDESWEKPVNVGYPINSMADDISIYILDKEIGAFTSSRSGGDDDIYMFYLNGFRPNAMLAKRLESCKDKVENINPPETTIKLVDSKVDSSTSEVVDYDW